MCHNAPVQSSKSSLTSVTTKGFSMYVLLNVEWRPWRQVLNHAQKHSKWKYYSSVCLSVFIPKLQNYSTEIDLTLWAQYMPYGKIETW